MNETITLYKIMILYMLKRVDFPLTTAQISEFMIEKQYTGFFRIQEALSEMIESDLISVESTHKRTLYHLTEQGAETIEFFRDSLSDEIKKDIDDFIKEKYSDLKEEVSIKSSYKKLDIGDYEVHCQIIEDRIPLVDLKLTLPTETEAKTIAANWTDKYQDIYAGLMEQLL